MLDYRYKDSFSELSPDGGVPGTPGIGNESFLFTKNPTILNSSMLFKDVVINIGIFFI